MNCYYGVFDVYHPSMGCVRTLVMNGVFTYVDLYNVNIRLMEELML